MSRSERTTSSLSPAEAAAAASIEAKISQAAHVFTQQILHLLGSSTLAELTALSQGHVKYRRGAGLSSSVPLGQLDHGEEDDDEDEDGEVNGVSVAPPPPPRPVSRSAVRVYCPVAGCQEMGIRPKMNFCRHHAATVPRAEQLRLREEQRRRQIQMTAAARLLAVDAELDEEEDDDDEAPIAVSAKNAPSRHA